MSEINYDQTDHSEIDALDVELLPARTLLTTLGGTPVRAPGTSELVARRLVALPSLFPADITVDRGVLTIHYTVVVR